MSRHIHGDMTAIEASEIAGEIASDVVARNYSSGWSFETSAVGRIIERHLAVFNIGYKSDVWRYVSGGTNFFV